MIAFTLFKHPHFLREKISGILRRYLVGHLGCMGKQRAISGMCFLWIQQMEQMEHTLAPSRDSLETTVLSEEDNE